MLYTMGVDHPWLDSAKKISSIFSFWCILLVDKKGEVLQLVSSLHLRR